MRSITVAVVAALILAAAWLFPVAAAPPRPTRPAGFVFNTAATANTDLFAADIYPNPRTDPDAYRITIGLSSTDSIVNVQFSDGTTDIGLDLNNGVALVAGRLYTFSWGAARSNGSSSYSFNLQCETGTTVAYLLVEEVQD